MKIKNLLAVSTIALLGAAGNVYAIPCGSASSGSLVITSITSASDTYVLDLTCVTINEPSFIYTPPTDEDAAGFFDPTMTATVFVSGTTNRIRLSMDTTPYGGFNGFDAVWTFMLYSGQLFGGITLVSDSFASDPIDASNPDDPGGAVVAATAQGGTQATFTIPGAHAYTQGQLFVALYDITVREAPVTVPEPHSLLLAMTSLGLLGFARRRKLS